MYIAINILKHQEVYGITNRDEPVLDANGSIYNKFKSKFTFKFTTKIIERIGNAGTKNVKTMVSLNIYVTFGEPLECH